MFKKCRDIGENRNHLSKVKQYFEKHVIVDEQDYPFPRLASQRVDMFFLIAYMTYIHANDFPLVRRRGSFITSSMRNFGPPGLFRIATWDQGLQRPI